MHVLSEACGAGQDQQAPPAVATEREGEGVARTVFRPPHEGVREGVCRVLAAPPDAALWRPAETAGRRLRRATGSIRRGVLAK